MSTSTPKSLVRKILQAKPSMYSSSLIANILGYQYVRAFAFYVHRVARPPHPCPPAYREVMERVVRDGFAVVPNFFSVEEYEAIRKEYARLEPSFVEGYSAVMLPHVEGLPLADSRFSAQMRKFFLENPFFTAFATAFLNRPYHFPLQGYALKISCDRDELTLPKNGGTNNLHFDAPTRVLKFFYLVEDVDADQGPLTYCRGSQRRGLKRLWLEYLLSIRYARNKWNPNHEGEYKTGEPWVKVTSEEMRRFGLVEEPITGKGNTLVIANVGGFHRRGPFRKAGARKTIEINFRSVETLRNDLFPLEMRLRSLLKLPTPAFSIPASEQQ